MIHHDSWMVRKGTVKHSTADPTIASSTALTPTKITKRRYVLVLTRKNASVYQWFTLGTVKNLVCHGWWALQYLALWATNINANGICEYHELYDYTMHSKSSFTLTISSGFLFFIIVPVITWPKWRWFCLLLTFWSFTMFIARCISLLMLWYG